MSENERPERSGIEAVDRLAELTPDEERHAALVDRVRAAAPSREITGRSLRRRVLAAVIAASIAIGLTALLWPALEPRSARAELIAALEATTRHTDEGLRLRIADEAGTVEMIWQPEPFLTATVEGVPGHREVNVRDYATHSVWRWTERDGRIVIGGMSVVDSRETWASYRNRMGAAISTQMAEKLRELRDVPDSWKITSADEDGLKRYDIRVFVSADRSPTRESYCVSHHTYWADPKSDRIVRMETADTGPNRADTPYPRVTDATPRLHYEYVYDAPPIRNVYDLGAPRDAKLADNRPAGRAKELLDRLNRAVDASAQREGMTMAVTIATAQANLRGPKLDNVTFYYRNRDRWCYADFDVGTKPGVDEVFNGPLQPTVAPPPGWPVVDVAAALKHVDGASFGMQRLIWGDARQTYWDEVTRPRGDEPFLFSLPGRAMASTESLRASGYWPDTTVDVERDGPNERLVVREYDRKDRTLREIRSATFDAATGRPIERRREVPLWGGAGRSRTQVYTFLDWQSLADGTPVPTRWRFEDAFDYEPGERWSFTTETTLKFDRDAKPPEAWFAVPK
jgi:hypothetical protein